MANPEVDAQQQASANPEMKSEFLEKMSGIPAVNSAKEYGTAVYNQVKGFNRFTSAALTAAESTALYLAVTAKPFLEKVQPQAKVIDQLACKGLVAVEEKAPFLMLPPEQLVDEARKITSSTLDFANQKVDDIKTYGTETLNNVKSYGMEKAAKVLNDTENLVDAYLPPAFGEGSHEASTESSSVYDRASKLTSKIGLRLYGHGVERVMVVHRVSEEYASKLSYILELVNQLKQNVANKSVQEVVDEAKLKATWVWDELNKEPSKSGDAEKSLEQRALSLARRTTSVLVHAYTTTTLPLASLPSTYRDGVQTASRYATELFTQLDQATNAGEITINLLQTVRQKVAALEEVIQNLKSQEIEMDQQKLVSHLQTPTSSGCPLCKQELFLDVTTTCNFHLQPILSLYQLKSGVEGNQLEGALCDTNTALAKINFLLTNCMPYPLQ